MVFSEHNAAKTRRKPRGANIAGRTAVVMEISRMKTILTFALAVAAAISAIPARAASSERAITVTLSGFAQTNSASGDLAMSFRATTKDLLQEISIATGTNLTTAKLFLVQDSIDDTNSSLRVVAKTSSNSVDVTQFFEFDPGDNFVDTTTATTTIIYAIDSFHFSTSEVDPNGLDLDFQGLSKETQRSALVKIGANKVPALSTSIKTDGIGELRAGGGFVGPLKGSISIGAPKFYP